MTTITRSFSRPLNILAGGALLIVLFVFQPAAVKAQWTTPNASQNINNTNTGNVGIGTTNPAYGLTVVKTNSAGGNGWGALFQEGGKNGVLIGSRGAGNATGSITGVLADLSNIANLSLNPFGGNVGIGTTSPDTYAKLHIVGSGFFGQDIQTTTNDWTRLRFVTPTRTWGFFLDGGSGGLGAGKFGLYDYTASAWRIVTDTSGNVGIGMTAPLYSLDVNGGVNAFRAKASTTSSSDAIATFENASGITAIIRANGNVGIGTTSPDGLQVGTTVTETPRGVDNVRVGVSVGTPRIIFEDAGSATQHEIDNEGGKLRFFRPGLISMVIDSSGSVGIGTPTPANKLHVAGSITVDGNINAKYQDVAEWVPSSEQLSAGTVVVLDTTKPNEVIASTQAYDPRVAGVISAQPGITLGESGQGKVLVATTGRVRIKVDASHGAIQVGDLLVTSGIAGVAMKSQPINIGGAQIHRPGTLIGKALEPLAQGAGEILVLLSLQ